MINEDKYTDKTYHKIKKSINVIACHLATPYQTKFDFGGSLFCGDNKSLLSAALECGERQRKP